MRKRSEVDEVERAAEQSVEPAGVVEMTVTRGKEIYRLVEYHSMDLGPSA